MNLTTVYCVGHLHLRHTRSHAFEITCLIFYMLSLPHLHPARDCALAQMAAFVDGQEHFTHLSSEESNHAYTTSRRIRKGRDLDLGPLVGVRGRFGPSSNEWWVGRDGDRRR